MGAEGGHPGHPTPFFQKKPDLMPVPFQDFGQNQRTHYIIPDALNERHLQEAVLFMSAQGEFAIGFKRHFRACVKEGSSGGRKGSRRERAFGQRGFQAGFTGGCLGENPLSTMFFVNS
jgi:hypothetical protein